VSGDNDVGRLVGDNRGTAEPANPLPVPGFTAVVAVVAFLVVVVRRCR
jgi:PGF-CTERM protein